VRHENTKAMATVGGATVVVNSNSPQPPTNICCRYATAILSLFTGGVLLVLGVITVGVLPGDPSPTGLWAGAIVALTGVIGILSTKKWNNNGLKAFYITIGVIATIVSGVSVIVLGIKTIWYAITLDCGFNNHMNNMVNAINNANKGNNLNWNVNTNTFTGGASCEDKDLAVALHVVQMVFCGFEFIVAIVGASLTCACCCGKENTTTVNVAPQQMIQMA